MLLPAVFHSMLLAGLRADDPGLPKEEELAGMSIGKLKAHLSKYGISSRDCVERRLGELTLVSPPPVSHLNSKEFLINSNRLSL